MRHHSFSTTVLLRSTFPALSILVSTRTLPPSSVTSGDEGVDSDFDKKSIGLPVRPLDIGV